MPTTMDECRAIQRWIETGVEEAPATVTRDELTRHLGFLGATLPSKAVDKETGRDRVAVYFRMLSGHTNAAIAYMSGRACAELDWFPTPHQCLEILADYPAAPSAREVARHNCQWFLQAQMEAFHQQLADGPVDQSVIDAQPDQWRRIADNKGLLRRDGAQYFQRRKAILHEQAA